MTRTARARLAAIFLAPLCAGFGGLSLFVLLSPGQVDRAEILAAVLVTGILMGALIAWLAARELGNGVGYVLAGAERLRAEEFGRRTPVPWGGGIGGLARAFNQLGDELGAVVREARTERDRLLTVLQRSADGVLAVDGEGRLAFVNTAARLLLDLPESATPASLRELSFVAAVRDHELADLLQRCRTTAAQQTQAIRLGAQRRAAEAIFLPLRDAGDWHYLGLLHDLSEVHRVEGQRRDFISNVSHELRTPLASIKAVVQVLADGGLEDEEQALAFLAGVDHEVDRLAQLVEEMLELSRIESGQVPFQFEAVDVGELYADAVRRLAAQAERAGVRLSWSASPGLLPLQADHERLLRALINLVHNAIKFTASGGSVSLEARARGGMAELMVRDTGAGIPAADRERIFERFYKVDRARSSAGTGLGLAIVKHTVQAHNGRIEVDSTVGVGSTFRLLIPFAYDPCLP